MSLLPCHGALALLASWLGCQFWKRAAAWVALAVGGVHCQCGVRAQAIVSPPEAPAELAKVIEASAVEFEFYRIPKPGQRYRAETRFHVDLDYKIRFRGRRLRVRGRWVERAEVKIYDVRVQIKHLMLLPIEMAEDDLWHSPVVKHEFDHVRISSDPRVVMLIRFLLDEIDAVEVATQRYAGSSNTIAGDEFRVAIDARIEAIVEEMRKLLQANYDLLDKKTTHGDQQSDLDDDFFSRLYTEENLRQMNFIFLDEASRLLRQRKYIAAGRL